MSNFFRSVATPSLFAVIFMFAKQGCAEEGITDDCYYFKLLVTKDETLSPDQRDRILSERLISLRFVWENDSLAAGGDYNYTNGMKLSWLHNPCHYNRTFLKNQFRSALRLFGNTSPDVYSGGVFGINMYTPDDLKASERIRTDRPYAGWLYGGINLQAVTTGNFPVSDTNKRRAEVSVSNLELQLGLTGKYTFQEQAQNFIHTWFTKSQISQGWDNQVKQRIGINALYVYRRNLFRNRWLRLTPHVGFNLGNLIQFVNGGGLLLIGKSGNDYPGTTIQPVDVQKPSKGMDDNPALVRQSPVLYGFIGVDARHLGSSIFVEGYGASQHDIDLIQDVYDLLIGLKWGNESRSLSYKLIRRSKEFRSTDPTVEKAHRIGQIEFAWQF